MGSGSYTDQVLLAMMAIGLLAEIVAATFLFVDPDRSRVRAYAPPSALAIAGAVLFISGYVLSAVL